MNIRERSIPDRKARKNQMTADRKSFVWISGLGIAAAGSLWVLARAGHAAAFVVVVFQFAWPPMDPAEMVPFVPGVLWVTYVFAAVLGIGRTFALELENDAMTALALAPGTRGWIFVGKATATWVLISVVQILTALVFALFFRVDLWTGIAGSLLILALANVSICWL